MRRLDLGRNHDASRLDLLVLGAPQVEVVRVGEEVRPHEAVDQVAAFDVQRVHVVLGDDAMELNQRIKQALFSKSACVFFLISPLESEKGGHFVFENITPGRVCNNPGG